MELSEKSIRFLEKQIPDLAEAAVTQAYWQALASGNSVLASDDGMIYEVFPDGSRKIVKAITPHTAVTLGEKRIIR
ncbi:MAG: hypothetical protein H7833_16385 [Magnetococcus sp. DMHC-1]|nr:hypothetical protein [Magnetococcales bacterium]